jgi:hypothetical protein
MAQHDYNIANQTASSARTDINNALAAIVSTNSGVAAAPTTTVANMIWYDTTNNILQIRDEGNTAWITLGTVDQGGSKFEPNQTIATQAEAEAGVQATKLMTAVRVAQAIDAQVVIPDTLGVAQSYSTTTLTTNTWYQNNTGRAIAIYYQLNTGGGDAYVSTTASGGFRVGGADGDSGTYDNGYFIVPDTHYYRTTGSSNRAASILS